MDKYFKWNFCTLLWKKTATQKIFCIAVISKMHFNKLWCDTRKIIPFIPLRFHCCFLTVFFNPHSTKPCKLHWLTTHLHAYGNERVKYQHLWYSQLRARRVLMLSNLFRTRRALSPQTLYSNNALLVLNRTSFKTHWVLDHIKIWSGIITLD